MGNRFGILNIFSGCGLVVGARKVFIMTMSAAFGLFELATYFFGLLYTVSTIEAVYFFFLPICFWGHGIHNDIPYMPGDDMPILPAIWFHSKSWRREGNLYIFSFSSLFWTCSFG